MGNTIVTIGIPVYNEEKYLAETIQSVLDQDYPDLKLLISDNCSSDGSLEIANEFAINDERIEVISQKQHITATGNFQVVLSNAVTKYFMWLGAHDLIGKTAISDGVKILETDPEVVLAYSKAKFIDTGSKVISSADSKIDTRQMSNVGDRLFFVVENLILCTAIHGLFRTEIARKLPFEKIIGPDLLLLFAAAHYGSFAELEGIGYYRREVRKETTEEVINRHSSFYNLAVTDPYRYNVVEHLKFYWMNNPLPFYRKFYFLLRLQHILRHKHGISSLNLAGTYLSQLFSKKSQ